MTHSGVGELHSIPEVIVQVREHRDPATGLIDRRTDSCHPGGCERGIIARDKGDVAEVGHGAT